MGRGGGGGGRGGGGRRGRGALAGAIGGRIAQQATQLPKGIDARVEAALNSPDMLTKYGPINPDVLPTPQELGFRVNAAHEVIANNLNAPKLGNTLLSAAEAEAKLKAMGFPQKQLQDIKDAGSLREIATIIPEGSKVIGSPGIEGIGVDVGGGKAWRVQWNQEKGNHAPVKSNDVGRHAVYPEWLKQYGNTWVEQKPRVSTVARDMSAAERARGELYLRASVGKKYKYIEQGDRADIHAGNWGKFNNADGTVTYAYLDPGAFPLKGGRVTNQGF